MFRALDARYTDSADWLAQPRARLFVQYERQLLRELLPRLTGYRCVQIGNWACDRELLASAGTLCQWQIGYGERASERAGADLCFDGRSLPLASASVDALVLTHGLEQVADAHALLRDCARVLSERGQLILLVFNPLSLWAVGQSWPARQRPVFRPCSSPPPAGRLYDWLRLLEFEPEQLWRYGLGFPLFGRSLRVDEGVGWRRGLAWMGQAYAIVARRQTPSMTPLGGRRSPARQAAAPALARGAARSRTDRSAR